MARDAWEVPHEEPFGLAVAFHGGSLDLAGALRAHAGQAARRLLLVQVGDETSLPALRAAIDEAPAHLLVCVVDPEWRRARGSLTHADLRSALHRDGRRVLVAGALRESVLGLIEMARPEDEVALVAVEAQRGAVLAAVSEGLERRGAFGPRVDPP